MLPLMSSLHQGMRLQGHLLSWPSSLYKYYEIGLQSLNPDPDSHSGCRFEMMRVRPEPSGRIPRTAAHDVFHTCVDAGTEKTPDFRACLSSFA